MVERIGAGLEDLMLAIERAKKAQQKYLEANPELRKKLIEARQEELAQEAAETKIREYLWRDIPRSIAASLVCGEDHAGNKIQKTAIDEEILQWIEQARRKTIILAGPVGTGKTIAACRWLMTQPSGKYVKAVHFARYNGKMPDDRPLVDEFYRAPALVIDELGMVEERDQTKIRDLLHDRTDNHLLTIAAINATPDVIDKILGQAVGRRVVAIGKMIWCKDVLCPGEKLRRAKKMGSKK